MNKKEQLQLDNYEVYIYCKQFYEAIYSEKLFILFNLTPREIDVLRDKCLLNMNRFQISKKYDITPERIRQIYLRALYKIKRRAAIEIDRYINYENNNERIKILEKENEYLKSQFSLNEPDLSILIKRIDDFDFSVRALNCFRASDIYTVGDLLKYNIKNIMKLRNFGQKTKKELDEFLKHNNLELKR